MPPCGWLDVRWDSFLPPCLAFDFGPGALAHMTRELAGDGNRTTVLSEVAMVSDAPELLKSFSLEPIDDLANGRWLHGRLLC